MVRTIPKVEGGRDLRWGCVCRSFEGGEGGIIFPILSLFFFFYRFLVPRGSGGRRKRQMRCAAFLGITHTQREIQRCGGSAYGRGGEGEKKRIKGQGEHNRTKAHQTRAGWEEREKQEYSSYLTPVCLSHFFHKARAKQRAIGDGWMEIGKVKERVGWGRGQGMPHTASPS